MARSRNDHDGRPSRVAVLGLGRFGASLAVELVRRGTEVLGVDSRQRVVQQFADELTHAAVADTTDIEALRQLDLPDYQRAVVGIGNDLEASILTTAVLVVRAHPTHLGATLRLSGAEQAEGDDRDSVGAAVGLRAGGDDRRVQQIVAELPAQPGERVTSASPAP